MIRQPVACIFQKAVGRPSGGIAAVSSVATYGHAESLHKASFDVETAAPALPECQPVAP